MTSVVKVHGFSKEDSGHSIVENCTRVIDYEIDDEIKEINMKYLTYIFIAGIILITVNTEEITS